MKLYEVEKRTAACDELSRVEPQNVESSSGGQVSNVEGWNRLAQSFFIKIDRSTQKLTTGSIHLNACINY
jgi:hypothetical protein